MRKESIYEHLERSRKFMMDINEEKYDVVLNFLKEWVKKDMIGLVDFKWMCEDVLLKNDVHNKNIVMKYVKSFEDAFGYEFNVNDDVDIGKEYIIDLLRLVLGMLHMGYKLKMYVKGGKKYYSIKKC